MIFIEYDSEKNCGTIYDREVDPQFKLILYISPKTNSGYKSQGEFERDFYDGSLKRLFDFGKVPFVDPPPPIPTSVTPRQARIVLALTPSEDPAFANLLQQVEAAFAALPEPDKTVAEITWNFSTEIQRSNPLITQMQAIIGFTDEQIDQLFIQAATL